MTTHRAVRLSFLLALALLAALPLLPDALESTAAGRLRASLAPDRLEEIRREMSELNPETAGRARSRTATSTSA